MARVLVADDQDDVRESLALLLRDEGFAVETVASPATVLRRVEAREYDALLVDLNYTRDTTSGREGLDLLARLGEMDSTLPVLVMTAWGTVAGAVEAMRRGARDYVQKPWDNDRLVATLRTQVELGRALRESRRLFDENARLEAGRDVDLIASAPAMAPVVELIAKVAPSNANVLVTGEHGTGKEVVAREIHRLSGRAERSLVVVNAGGLPEGLLESELFGHVRGAFTDARADRAGCFEIADGGTLFLDEIGNMPASQQTRLLRVLQTGEVQRLGSSKMRGTDVRVVSATNANLDEAIASGAFREDLLYRLNTVEVQLPPLRDRAEDIPLLAAHFLGRLNRRSGKRVVFSGQARESMSRYRWPGNVRELEHAVERASLLCSGGVIEADDLRLRGRSRGTAADLEAMSLGDAEKFLIRRALERCHGNVSDAAAELGVSRSALYRRLDRHGLDPRALEKA